MNPDIVYIYNHTCSKWRGQELRYSLRSLHKCGVSYRKVFIIGDKPAYLNDTIIHIPHEDSQNHCKERRIYEKLLVACRTKEISDSFVFFNDDFFLSTVINFEKLPFYYFSSLDEKITNRKSMDIYRRALQNTLIELADRNKERKHFDIHYPMLYNKETFIRVMEEYDWNVQGGYVIKSLYANSLGIKGLPRKDHKIYLSHNKKEILETIRCTDLFSTETITRTMAEVFNVLYSARSPFEIIDSK